MRTRENSRMTCASSCGCVKKPKLVLFVVAADEGWKPQSEEHLQILDVLGASGAVVALTKMDLVDADHLELRRAEVRDRLAGTALAGASIVPVTPA